MKKFYFYLPLFTLLLMVFACTENGDNHANEVQNKPQETTSLAMFTKLQTEETGIDFINYNKESNDYNYYTYEYFYNGGGVAVADFNNDGFQDIYFTANMAPNKLFLNKGDLKFEDISNTANINSTDKYDWCTGVTVVDINSDGYQDIYVCRSGDFNNVPLNRENLLFVNNGDLTFTEKAKEYGLADNSFSTQACFFDFDLDGDLDMYLLNHPREFIRVGATALGQILLNEIDDDPRFYDKFYVNEGGKFVEKSKQLGTNIYAHGLGVVASDVNNDGYPDLYIGNDYSRPDYLFINQKGKGFVDEAQKQLKHMPKFSMGVDVGDINNDGYQDIFSVEMLAEDNYRKKTNMAGMNPDLYWAFVNNGLYYQNMYNCMQLNNGNNTFSEISWMSGIAETDWSWCPLLADFDNDGWVDLFVSNGYKRDVIDKDASKKNGKTLAAQPNKFEELIGDYPTTKLPNYAFKNNGDYTFTKVSDEWGIGERSNSNGAAYADFDNDGDIDIVVNNIEEQASFYRNNLNKNNYLAVDLKDGNTIPFGAKVAILDKEIFQFRELTNVHGFQSTSSTQLHFGLNSKEIVDSLLVIWPNGNQSIHTNIAANQKLVINKSDANSIAYNLWREAAPIFNDKSELLGGDFEHKENEFDDYKREVLLPHKLSEEGAIIAQGDVNGDGLSDYFIGNGGGHIATLYINNGNGYSQSVPGSFTKDRMCEDAGAAFFDYDGDGDLDLYVVSGSNEYDLESPYMQDRIYQNDGAGNFTRTVNVLPKMTASGSCVKPYDFDNDGDMDLFVGGFQQPGLYPQAGTSYLLQNNNGVFVDVTKNTAPELASIGMVKDAVWANVHGDDKAELVVVGHWMPITVFGNDNNQLNNLTKSMGLEHTNGWWNCVNTIDANKDGKLDIVAGNLGFNTKHKATQNEPFKVYADDFDGNGTNDIVLGYYNNGVCYPVRGRQCTSEQVPLIANKIPTYTEFGKANLEQVYGVEALNNATARECYLFKSSLFENTGNGFTQKDLPPQTQFAPIMSMAVTDYNKDGYDDIFCVGNQYTVEIETGRYDASYGHVLAGNGNGGFEVVDRTGFHVDGACSSIAISNGPKAPEILVARNSSTPILFQVK